MDFNPLEESIIKGDVLHNIATTEEMIAPDTQ